MGTCSYVLTGTEQGMQETFGSTCHGAVSNRRNIFGCLWKENFFRVELYHVRNLDEVLIGTKC
jgi:hypothetical protein